jgi:Domain of unknown function (DUF3943)
MHHARHLMLAVVFTLACSLPAVGAAELIIDPRAWATKDRGEPTFVSAASDGAAVHPDRTPAGNAATQPSADHQSKPQAAAPDWRGAARDAAYFVGYQFVGVAVLAAMPESVSGWSAEDKKNGFKEWRENISSPVWDDDSWWLNYVTHPYWGGAYYIRGRERGLDRWQSFWYSAVLSTLWEYGVEAIAEPVSIQDMIVTPVLGSLVGEYLFSPWRAHIRAKGGPLSWSDKAVLVLTDPLGTINDQLDRWVGVKTSVQLQPIVGRPQGRQPPALGAPAAGQKTITGWRVQLQMVW